MRTFLGTYVKINGQPLRKAYSVFKIYNPVSFFLVSDNETMTFKTLRLISKYLLTQTKAPAARKEAIC